MIKSIEALHSDHSFATAVDGTQFERDVNSQPRRGTCSTNSYSHVSAVVVTEIMNHPHVGPNEKAIEEFIELQNLGGVTC